MTELLSFEEWKKKYFTLSPDSKDAFTKNFNFTEEDLERETNHYAQVAYDTYKLRITNPEEYQKRLDACYNKETGCYEWQ